MPAKKPVTFDQLFNKFMGKDGRRAGVPLTIRNNTHAYLETNDNGDYRIDINLHGYRLASLYEDGTVRVWKNKWSSVTTQIRLNDVLEPLGYHVHRDADQQFTVNGEGWVDGRLFSPLPECMMPGWNPLTPGREAEASYLDACIKEGVDPT